MAVKQQITDTVRVNHAQTLLKIIAGKKPTREEEKDFNAVERQRRLEVIREYVENVPLTDLQDWFGHGTPRRMQVNQLNDIHNKYGLPVSKSPVSLPKVFQALRTLLKRNSKVINAAGDDDDEKPAILKKKEAKLDSEIERLQQQIRSLETRNQKELDILVDKSIVFHLYQITADVLRSCGEDFARLDSITGKQAQERLNGAVDAIEQKVTSTIGEQQE